MLMNTLNRPIFQIFAALMLAALLGGCAMLQSPRSQPHAESFTLAVIPDTQNYLDFRHQTAEGFELDGSELFIQQMQYIAARSHQNGGDIVFAASVGDVWQHQTIAIAPDHLLRGIGLEPNPILGRRSKRTEQVLGFELPKAVEGYRILHEAGLPFGVAPGNHDYDAAWSVAGFPPDRSRPFSELKPTVEDYGLMHVGGLENFRAVFGENTAFFKDKPWYVASHRGGANSAQMFSAAGYEFLHIALEMQPGDDVFAWVETVLAKHPDVPTIVTTHDYLDASGQRIPRPLIDLSRVDPDFHNSPEQMWEKLIRQHDQIFMVLCGHNRGQFLRVDDNLQGNPVYQILADYQDRGQAAVEAGRKRHVGLGDGWLRLMRFDFSTETPTITVKTFSSYYKQFSGEVPEYAKWYKRREQPKMSDADFYKADDYVIQLEGFRQRFQPSLW